MENERLLTLSQKGWGRTMGHLGLKHLGSEPSKSLIALMDTQPLLIDTTFDFTISHLYYLHG